MHCHLLIPGLLWPHPASGQRIAPLPHLEALLSKAELKQLPGVEAEGWLCREFGVAKQFDWPIAPLSLEPARDGFWLRADPVHLQLSRDKLFLFDPSLLDLTLLDTEKFVGDLNKHFGPDGYEFIASSPDAWCLRLPRPAAIATTSLSIAAGQHVDPYLPKEDKDLLHLMNEIQMLLYTHPLNDDRERDGKHTVNSLWFWGGGVLPETARSRFLSLAANEPFCRGLAKQSGIAHSKLPTDAASWLGALSGAGPHLALLASLRFPAVYGEIGEWEKALIELDEKWFAPLHLALKEKRIAKLSIHAMGAEQSLQCDLSTADLRKFWRRLKPLLSYSQ